MKRIWLISDLRTCRKCNEEKPLEDFVKNKTVKTGYTNECKECHNHYLRERRENNPDVVLRNRESGAKWRAANPEADRRKYLFRKFNITIEEYNELLQAQGGVCAICGREESVVRRSKSGKEMLAVDHCHDTGKIRGLLCFKCNTAIGALGDTLEDLQRVIDYLNRGTNNA